MTESANNTATSVSFITDAAGKFWTLVPTTAGAAQVYYNGAVDPSAANVASLLYHNHTVYYMNTTAHWYVFMNPGWLPIADDPRTLAESAAGITVTTVGSAIVDSYLESWTLANSATKGLQIACNGVVDPVTQIVVLLHYTNHRLYQQNSDGGWWYKTKSTDAWIVTTDPRSTMITGITLSNASFAGGAPSGTVVGSIAVMLSSGSFSGTLSLAGTNASLFQIVGNNLITNGVVSAGNYSIDITATQTGTAPNTKTMAITATSTSTITHYGTSPPTTAPTGWKVSFFDDFTGFASAGTMIGPTGGALPLCTTGAMMYNGMPARYTMTMASTSRNIGGLEQELYCDPVMMNGINPFSQSGSVLTITARVPTASEQSIMKSVSSQYNNAASMGGGAPFISGILTTWPFLKTNSGYFEINCKCPAGAGMWHQFWLKDDWGKNSQGNPIEVDVFEAVGGRPYNMSYTTHYANGSQQSNSSQNFAPTLPADTTAGFHTYGGLWCPNYIAYYFDGKLVYQTAPIPSSDPIWVIIALAIGKGITGQIAQASEFPVQFQIDWWRYSLLGPA